MESIEGAHGGWERFERSSEHGRRQLQERDPAEDEPDDLAVRLAQFAGVDSGPDLVFEQSTRDLRLLPPGSLRAAVLREKVRQRD